MQRDLIVRYRTPVMGIGWAVATPFTQMLVFTLVFARVAHVAVGMPYPLYAYIGLAAWTLTAAALREATNSLSGNPVLLTKVRFPREVLPIAAVCTAFTDFVVGVLLIGGMMWFYHTGVTWAVLLFPVVLITQLVFVAALALLLSVANLLWRDVKHVFDVAIVVWMFASAVVYPAQDVGGWLGAILAANPMTQIIEAYRDVLVRGRPPAIPSFTVTAAGSLVLLAGAWTVFRRSERRFAEYA